MKIINSQIKGKIGGRKAPQISLDKFDEICQSWYDKYSDDIESEGLSGDIEEALAWIIGNRDNICGCGKAQKDLKKYELEFENVETETNITSTGIPYILCRTALDSSPLVIWFIYWDGKSFRAYIPTRGNYVCPKAKKQFCIDWEYENEKIALINSGIISLNMDEDAVEEFIEQILSGEIDFSSEDMCIEEFEDRLEVI